MMTTEDDMSHWLGKEYVLISENGRFLTKIVFLNHKRALNTFFRNLPRTRVQLPHLNPDYAML